MPDHDRDGGNLCRRCVWSAHSVPHSLPLPNHEGPAWARNDPFQPSAVRSEEPAERNPRVSRVFGYACLTGTAGASTVDRWRHRIVTHCATEGLALELVFIDNGVSDTTRTRPGWTALLDILGLDDGPEDRQRLVVVPGLAHLSGDLATLVRMRAQLDHAGATTSIMPRTPHRRPRDRTSNRPA